MKRLFCILAAAITFAGCAAEKFDSAAFVAELPTPDEPGSSPAVQQEYHIGPLDKLSVAVFQMKDLSLPKVQVDTSGQLQLPMIGSVRAEGRTTDEVAKEISDKLGKCCLQNPQVSVLVEEAVSQQITVTGAVMESNVYTLRGHTSLLQAITMAKGPDRRDANLKRVAVYRMKNGQRVGALFNVEDIRAGKSPDPEVVGGDTIIVDTSNSRSIWRDVVSSVPFFGVFAAF